MRWFTLPNFFYFAPVPLLTGAVALLCGWGLIRDKDATPFYSSIVAFPARLSRSGDFDLPVSRAAVADDLADRRSAGSSQIFMLIGTLVLLPIILGYTLFVYWLFRGKVREGETYH